MYFDILRIFCGKYRCYSPHYCFLFLVGTDFTDFIFLFLYKFSHRNSFLQSCADTPWRVPAIYPACICRDIPWYVLTSSSHSFLHFTFRCFTFCICFRHSNVHMFYCSNVLRLNSLPEFLISNLIFTFYIYLSGRPAGRPYGCMCFILQFILTRAIRESPLHDDMNLHLRLTIIVPLNFEFGVLNFIPSQTLQPLLLLHFQFSANTSLLAVCLH